MCPRNASCIFLRDKFPVNHRNSTVDSSSASSDADPNAEASNSNSQFTGENPNEIVRFYKLYNRCSGGYLQMFYNVINANGKYDSPLVDLRVQPAYFAGQIRILSQNFGKYLCFNKRKRITARYNGRSQRCVFSERISENHFTEFESAWSPGTFLGFNRRGRFLKPQRYFSKRHCYQYMKIQQSHLVAHPYSSARKKSTLSVDLNDRTINEFAFDGRKRRKHRLRHGGRRRRFWRRKG